MTFRRCRLKVSRIFSFFSSFRPSVPPRHHIATCNSYCTDIRHAQARIGNDFFLHAYTTPFPRTTERFQQVCRRFDTLALFALLPYAHDQLLSLEKRGVHPVEGTTASVNDFSIFNRRDKITCDQNWI